MHACFHLSRSCSLSHTNPQDLHDTQALPCARSTLVHTRVTVCTDTHGYQHSGMHSLCSCYLKHVLALPSHSLLLRYPHINHSSEPNAASNPIALTPTSVPSIVHCIILVYFCAVSLMLCFPQFLQHTNIHIHLQSPTRGPSLILCAGILSLQTCPSLSPSAGPLPARICTHPHVPAHPHCAFLLHLPSYLLAPLPFPLPLLFTTSNRFLTPILVLWNSQPQAVAFMLPCDESGLSQITRFCTIHWKLNASAPFSCWIHSLQLSSSSLPSQAKSPDEVHAEQE